MPLSKPAVEVQQPARIHYAHGRIVIVGETGERWSYEPRAFQRCLDEGEDAMALWRAEQRGVVVSPHRWMRAANRH